MQVFQMLVHFFISFFKPHLLISPQIEAESLYNYQEATKHMVDTGFPKFLLLSKIWNFIIGNKYHQLFFLK